MSAELNTYLESLRRTDNHFSGIAKINRNKQEKVGQEAKKTLLDIVGGFNLPYFYSRFPNASYLSELPDDTSDDDRRNFIRGLVLESGIYRKKPEKSDPMIILERLGIYQIPIGKKGPKLSGIKEIDIASYSRWLHPTLGIIQRYLVVYQREAIKFADRLNSNA